MMMYLCDLQKKPPAHAVSAYVNFVKGLFYLFTDRYAIPCSPEFQLVHGAYCSQDAFQGIFLQHFTCEIQRSDIFLLKIYLCFKVCSQCVQGLVERLITERKHYIVDLWNSAGRHFSGTAGLPDIE